MTPNPLNAFNYILTSDNSLMLFQPSYAQPSSINGSESVSHHTNGTSIDQTGKTILRQGVVTSYQARDNETSQIAVILPYRDDGKSYSGTLTFSASQPVGVGLLHKLTIDNDTLSKIDFNKYASNSHEWIRDMTAHRDSNMTGHLQVISALTPDYGTSTPFYSASIPFVANSVALWSDDGVPFIAEYEVSATIAQPEIVNHIELNNTK